MKVRYLNLKNLLLAKIYKSLINCYSVFKDQLNFLSVAPPENFRLKRDSFSNTAFKTLSK